MSVYAWENIKEVTYRSELIDGVEVIYPMSSNKGTLKTVDFETAMSTNFGGSLSNVGVKKSTQFR